MTPADDNLAEQVVPNSVDTGQALSAATDTIAALIAGIDRKLPISGAEVTLRKLEMQAAILRKLVTGQQARGACALRGFSTSLPVPDLLEFMSTYRKTGTLRVSTQVETFTLELLEGDVVHAGSDYSCHEQLLGSILVARDSISTEQLEDFFRNYSVTGRHFGEAMVRQQIVSRDDLQDALEEQVQGLFRRLHTSTDAAFYFYEGAHDDVEARIRLNVRALLLESAAQNDESLRSLSC